MTRKKTTRRPAPKEAARKAAEAAELFAEV